jgi:hypothetical protein
MTGFVIASAMVFDGETTLGEIDVQVIGEVITAVGGSQALRAATALPARWFGLTDRGRIRGRSARRPGLGGQRSHREHR